MSTLNYRADIDGLRCIAVVSVLLYHFGFGWVSGGYVGVDIFFVISGYLITSIILKECHTQKFSLIDFYERRLRRIIPAAFIVIMATFLVAHKLLFPADYKEYAYSVISTVFYVSNIFFWKQSGYFETASEQKPLLHTWSLGVEEQFYIFFPIFIMIAYRFLPKKILFYGLLFLVLASLALSEYLVSGLAKYEAAFYLLPSRAWELGVGALLAFHIIPNLKIKFLNNITALIGVLALFISIFFYQKITPFPGVYALLPCIGTALLLYAGQNSGGMVTSVLSLKPFTFIGKISYSLYLWHWPLVAYAQYRYGHEISLTQQCLFLVLSFLLAYLSWRFVETPFRNRKFLTRRSIFILTGVATLISTVMAMWVIMNNGFPNRYPPEVAKIAKGTDRFNPLRKTCHFSDLTRAAPSIQTKLDGCVIGDSSQEEISAVIWGDSHADSLTPAVNALLKEVSLKGLQYTKSSCPPLPNTYRLSLRSSQYCYDYNSMMREFILNTEGIKYVFITGRWASYEDNISRSKDGVENLVVSLEVIEESLLELMNDMRKAGKSIVVVGPVPEVNFDVPLCFSKQWAYKDKDRFSCKDITYKEFYKRQENIIPVFEKVRNMGASVVFPHEILCDYESCKVQENGNAFYYDNDHMTIEGALELLPALRGAID